MVNGRGGSRLDHITTAKASVSVNYLPFTIYYLPACHWRTFSPDRAHNIREWERILPRTFPELNRFLKKQTTPLSLRFRNCVFTAQRKTSSLRRIRSRPFWRCLL